MRKTCGLISPLASPSLDLLGDTLSSLHSSAFERYSSYLTRRLRRLRKGHCKNLVNSHLQGSRRKKGKSAPPSASASASASAAAAAAAAASADASAPPPPKPTIIKVSLLALGAEPASKNKKKSAAAVAAAVAAAAAAAAAAASEPSDKPPTNPLNNGGSELIVLLCQIERAWSTGMANKAKYNTRKMELQAWNATANNSNSSNGDNNPLPPHSKLSLTRGHFLSSLLKSSKLSLTLLSILVDLPEAIVPRQTVLEAAGYATNLLGCYMIEKGAAESVRSGSGVRETFELSRDCYGRLSVGMLDGGVDSQGVEGLGWEYSEGESEVFKRRMVGVSQRVRYCEYQARKLEGGGASTDTATPTQRKFSPSITLPESLKSNLATLIGDPAEFNSNVSSSPSKSR